MRVSYEMIFGALAVLSVGACRGSTAAPDPASGAPASKSEPAPAAQPVATTVATPEASAAPAVDAGKEVRGLSAAPLPNAAQPSKPGKDAPKEKDKNAPASCGAQGCTPEMKKGNK